MEELRPIDYNGHVPEITLEDIALELGAAAEQIRKLDEITERMAA